MAVPLKLGEPLNIFYEFHGMESDSNHFNPVFVSKKNRDHVRRLLKYVKADNDYLIRVGLASSNDDANSARIRAIEEEKLRREDRGQNNIAKHRLLALNTSLPWVPAKFTFKIDAEDFDFKMAAKSTPRSVPDSNSIDIRTSYLDGGFIVSKFYEDDEAFVTSLTKMAAGKNLRLQVINVPADDGKSVWYSLTTLLGLPKASYIDVKQLMIRRLFGDDQAIDKETKFYDFNSSAANFINFIDLLTNLWNDCCDPATRVETAVNNSAGIVGSAEHSSLLSAEPKTSFAVCGFEFDESESDSVAANPMDVHTAEAVLVSAIKNKGYSAPPTTPMELFIAVLTLVAKGGSMKTFCESLVKVCKYDVNISSVLLLANVPILHVL